jgi:hypothetical protein
VTSEDKTKADGEVSSALAALLTAQTKLGRNPGDKELQKAVDDARVTLSNVQQTQSKTDDALNKFNMANGNSKSILT